MADTVQDSAALVYSAVLGVVNGGLHLATDVYQGSTVNTWLHMESCIGHQHSVGVPVKCDPTDQRVLHTHCPSAAEVAMEGVDQDTGATRALIEGETVEYHYYWNFIDSLIFVLE